MKTIIASILILSVSLSFALAQNGQLELSFSGNNVMTGTYVPLDSVTIENLTRNCDTTIFGEEPTLLLQWTTGLSEKTPLFNQPFNLQPCFPNPFLAKTNFRILLNESEHLNIRVYNVNGVLISSYEKQLYPGSHSFEISTDENMLYFLSVDNGVVEQFVKLVSLRNVANGNRKFELIYKGVDGLPGYKASTNNGSFEFLPGDELSITGSASGYFDSTIFDSPSQDTNYVFEFLTNQTEKRVLLEIFTGHKCVNSPEWLLFAQELADELDNRLIITALHAGYYALPDATGYYTADLTTLMGEQLHTDFLIFACPIGMVNRTTYNSNMQILPVYWENMISTQLAIEPVAELSLESIFYPEYCNIEINVGALALTELDGKYKLCVFVTENNFISPQKNNNPNVGPSPDWLDFEHQNLLRGSINGTYGEYISATGFMISGEVYHKEYLYTIDEAWVAENCNVIAYLYNEDTWEIIQVVEKAVIVD
jgi:hypothetical protein